METSKDPDIRNAVEDIIIKASEYLPNINEQQSDDIAKAFMIERLTSDKKTFHHAILQKLNGRVKWSLLEMDLNRLRRMLEMTSEKLLMRIVKL